MEIKLTEEQENILDQEKNFEFSLILNNKSRVSINGVESTYVQMTPEDAGLLYDYCVNSEEPEIIKLAHQILKQDAGQIAEPYKF